MERRSFIKTAGLAAAGMGLAVNETSANSGISIKNRIPRWRGFNLLDYFF